LQLALRCDFALQQMCLQMRDIQGIAITAGHEFELYIQGLGRSQVQIRMGLQRIMFSGAGNPTTSPAAAGGDTRPVQLLPIQVQATGGLCWLRQGELSLSLHITRLARPSHTQLPHLHQGILKTALQCQVQLRQLRVLQIELGEEFTAAFVTVTFQLPGQLQRR